MCGLSFYISKNKSYDKELNDSLKKIHHRGPDSNGTFTTRSSNNFIGLGHKRLSIIDLTENGHQPMSIDQSTNIIFVGEIYNFKELKSELEKDGTDFKSTSDTEVILQMYKQKGIAGLKMLRGMFSIVIYDSNNQTVLAFRDPLGIKPLYVCRTESGSWYGSSEIKGLTPFKEINWDISMHDVYEFMNNGFLYEPKTGYESVKKIKPGHLIEINLSNSDFKEHKLYDIEDSKSELDFDDLLKKSVKNQSYADVNLGLFFSGGVDSSVLAKSNESLSLIFAEYEQGNNSDLDKDAAYQLSKLLNKDLKVLQIKTSEETESSILEKIDFVAQHTEELISDYTFLPTYELSKAARKNGYTVMLSGMGGDEIFAGYPRYILVKYEKIFRPFLPIFKFLHKFSFTPKFLEKKIERLISFLSEKSWPIGYTRLIGFLSRDELKDLYGDNEQHLYDKFKIELERQCDFECKDKVKWAQYLDLNGFLAHNLMVTDKATMLNSIEMRVPLLDEALVHYGLSHRTNSLLSFYESKKPLLNFLFKTFPKKIFQREKVGFNPPLDGIINKLGEKTVKAELFQLESFLNKRAIEKIIDDHFYTNKNNTYKIWQLLYLKSWLKSCNDKKARLGLNLE